jgi:hypothetical protein
MNLVDRDPTSSLIECPGRKLDREYPDLEPDGHASGFELDRHTLSLSLRDRVPTSSSIDTVLTLGLRDYIPT